MNFNKRNTYESINQSSMLGGPGGEDFGNIPRCREDPANGPGAGGLNRKQPSEMPGASSRFDCNSAQAIISQEIMNEYGLDTAAKRKEYAKNDCSVSWFNDPWVGPPKICDGEPYQSWWDKGKGKAWKCAPKTECRYGGAD